jgi:curved DNA-binding protein
MNHYETLGVANDATPSDIKLAYRKLARKHHPDLGGDIAKFQKISEAYEILNDADKKAHYDHTLRPNQSHVRYPNFTDRSYQDFGQMFGFNFTNTQRNSNITIQLDVDFSETLDGCQKTVEFQISRGRERVTIDIPAGIYDQTVLQMAGRGDNALLVVPRGTLEIIVKVRQNPRFIRINDNVLTDININCFQAITGIDYEIETPRNKRIKIIIPPGSQSGTQLGINNEGFYRSDGTYGKFIVKIQVTVPTRLTREQILLVQQIQKMGFINS